jgi:3-deoxy-manno-octulosonate cytidylyltransferase (CMP-KDO synthetase)
LKPTPLEIIESVDMNRLLENGINIKMIPIDQSTFAVDTEKDLKHVGNLMKNDKLMKTYCSGS